MQDRLIKMRELSELTGISRQTLLKKVRDGKLPFVIRVEGSNCYLAPLSKVYDFFGLQDREIATTK